MNKSPEQEAMDGLHAHVQRLRDKEKAANMRPVPLLPTPPQVVYRAGQSYIVKLGHQYPESGDLVTLEIRQVSDSGLYFLCRLSGQQLPWRNQEWEHPWEIIEQLHCEPAERPKTSPVLAWPPLQPQPAQWPAISPLPSPLDLPHRPYAPDPLIQWQVPQGPTCSVSLLASEDPNHIH